MTLLIAYLLMHHMGILTPGTGIAVFILWMFHCEAHGSVKCSGCKSDTNTP
jgi:hypothetical protein